MSIFNKFSRGHIGKWWEANDYKNLNYIKQPVTIEEENDWKNKGYDYVKSFTGWMYDSRNPMPNFVNSFESIFPLKKLSYTFYKMKTLEIMPEHVDHFRTYIKLTGANYKQIKRVLIMLENWKPGHYLEIAGKGITDWIAGDYFIWDSDVPHAASNIGVEDRYTLQITGIYFTDEQVYQKLHWYNIGDLPNKKESDFSIQMFHIKKHLQNNHGKPYMVYMYNQNIKELENLIHKNEVIDDLNNHGLDIYLNEPLCSYFENAPILFPPLGTKHTLGFYSEFDQIIYDEATNKCFDKKNIEINLRADELDSILSYVQKNNLKNVNVHTCDYNVEKYYGYYKKFFNLKCNDIFLNTFDLKQFEPITEIYESNKFYKRFLCLNFRYAPHRQFITAYLNHSPEISETLHCTWYFRAGLETIAREPWIDLFLYNWLNREVFDKILHGVTHLNFKSPFNIDLNIQDVTSILHPYFKDMYPKFTLDKYKNEKNKNNIDLLKDCYKHIFVDIVNESRFAQPTANYSEKTLRPMFYKKPFILVAPPFTLQYVREQGYKTFSDFWDESYDSEVNHADRLFKIFAIIDNIYSKSIEELKEIYKNMTPILEHNRNILLEKNGYTLRI